MLCEWRTFSYTWGEIDIAFTDQLGLCQILTYRVFSQASEPSNECEVSFLHGSYD